MPPLVQILDLTKRFGRTIAVSKLSFDVEEGTVLGLIGPNGAGKSTTLKMLATLLRPNSGDATVGGHSITFKPSMVRHLIGYMPDVSGLYEDMVVHEYLRFFASIYKMKGARAEKAIGDVLTLTGMHPHLGVRCGALSRGLSQRLHVARVLLHDPKLLLLDEPAAGLDPRARIEFRDLVLSLRKMGKTLIISSHILSELGEMCDSIAIIEQSKLVYCGPVREAVRKVTEEGRIVRIAARDEPESGHSRGDLMVTIRDLPYVDAVREGDADGHILVRLKPDFEELFKLNQEIVDRGFKVERFAEEHARLEDAFLHLTRDAATT